LALSVEAQLDYWRTAMVHGWVRWLLWALAYSMGPLWLLAAWGAARNWPFLASSTLYLIPLLAPLLRTTDTERALMLSFPVVFPLAASVLDRHRGTAAGVVIAAIAIACQLGAQVTFEWAPTFRLGVVSPKDVVFLLLCLAPLAAVIAFRASGAAVSELKWPDRVTLSR
jgi:hypothetical protein